MQGLRPNCAMPEGPDVSEDRLLGGHVRLRQPRRGHRAGTDAVLAARLAGEGERIVDLGAATGAVGLMLAALRPQARVTLVERDPTLVSLAWENVGLNEFAGRVAPVQLDVFAPWAEWRTSWPEALVPLGQADLVVTNPPFFEAGEGRPSPDAGRRAAHEMAGGGLPEWIAAASRLLRPRGCLVLIHRADALGACLSALSRGFGGIGVRAIHSRAGENATRILVTARKGMRGPLAIHPPLILHGPVGGFSPEAAALHEGPAEASEAGR